MIVSIRIAIFSSLISLTSGDKNVFHDCDVFAPFSGLPLGGEGEGNRRAERAKSLEFIIFLEVSASASASASRAREFAMPLLIGRSWEAA
jgi:hypothetical protein